MSQKRSRAQDDSYGPERRAGSRTQNESSGKAITGRKQIQKDRSRKDHEAGGNRLNFKRFRVDESEVEEESLRTSNYHNRKRSKGKVANLYVSHSPLESGSSDGESSHNEGQQAVEMDQDLLSQIEVQDKLPENSQIVERLNEVRIQSSDMSNVYFSVEIAPSEDRKCPRSDASS
jgi:hypothetical protein